MYMEPEQHPRQVKPRARRFTSVNVLAVMIRCTARKNVKMQLGPITRHLAKRLKQSAKKTRTNVMQKQSSKRRKESMQCWLPLCLLCKVALVPQRRRGKRAAARKRKEKSKLWLIQMNALSQAQLIGLSFNFIFTV
jgi:hypothetical protein